MSSVESFLSVRFSSDVGASERVVRKFVREVADGLSYTYERRVSPKDVAYLAEQAAHPLPDSTVKMTAPLPSGGAGFLLMSGVGNADLVARSVRNLETVRRRVDEEVAAPILRPARTGALEGLSWAIWPTMVPFDRGGSLRRRLAAWRHRGAVLAWCQALAEQTRSPAAPERVAADLDRIIGDDAMPERVRASATAAARRLKDGWSPCHCVQHGDFWAGNLLLPDRKGAGPQFSVIDWGGMRPDGYPFFDFLHMAASLRMGTRARAGALARYADALEVNAEDVPGYLLAALGMIGRNLEHFPAERYRAMVKDRFDELARLQAAPR